ncbi:IclR family transcriptional regulator [Streptomyces sp. GQFP]|uniref:IclR family transcriptional regulator n=1 Tax=Streptomyces sp. GQFP TaxID=2907545 RepID=UPI001F160963|nr:IclR family transcriptional regulator [Streptomyces sp. GQFP]UIX29159.1 IclR family transcriptional regulator [Streptomyces sp. GQFP]
MTLIAASPVSERTPVENVSSIAKAARVLRALATAGVGELGVTRIALSAELPKSTTHRVLAELIGEGLVAHSGSRYRLGPGWFALQEALSSSEWLQMVERARIPLAELFERTKATVHLGVLDGDRVLYLEKLTASGGTSVPTRVGAHMPASCTAVGKVLLAHSPPDVVRALAAKPLPVLARRSIVTPRLLLAQLEEIRKSGVAYDMEESQAGVFCVAAPVFRAGRAVAAVSVTRVGSRGLTAPDPAEARSAAKQISRWIDDTGA